MNANVQGIQNRERIERLSIETYCFVGGREDGEIEGSSFTELRARTNPTRPVCRTIEAIIGIMWKPPTQTERGCDSGLLFADSGVISSMAHQSPLQRGVPWAMAIATYFRPLLEKSVVDSKTRVFRANKKCSHVERRQYRTIGQNSSDNFVANRSDNFGLTISFVVRTDREAFQIAQRRLELL